MNQQNDPKAHVGLLYYYGTSVASRDGVEHAAQAAMVLDVTDDSVVVWIGSASLDSLGEVATNEAIHVRSRFNGDWINEAMGSGEPLACYSPKVEDCHKILGGVLREKAKACDALAAKDRAKAKAKEERMVRAIERCLNRRFDREPNRHAFRVSELWRESLRHANKDVTRDAVERLIDLTRGFRMAQRGLDKVVVRRRGYKVALGIEISRKNPQWLGLHHDKIIANYNEATGGDVRLGDEIEEVRS